MKFAVFGDIHANLEALEAVLEDAREQNCQRFACIGDIVGYNANPSECVTLLRELDCPVVLGNHDQQAANLSSLEDLNEQAALAMDWTRAQLSEADKQWLSRLPYSTTVRDFTITHATLDSPESWKYIQDRYDALSSFSYQHSSLCFFGHTHRSVCYISGKDIEQSHNENISLQSTSKYLINVGSVGQPRDNDWRACYVIYDDQAKTLQTRRVEYDVRLAQNKIAEVGLPELLANRLVIGK